MVLERVGKEAVEKDVGDGVLGIGGMYVTKSVCLLSWPPATNVTNGGMAGVDGVEHGGECMAEAVSIERWSGWRCGV